MPSAPPLRVLAQFNGFPGVGAAGADQHRHTTIDMIDRKPGNGFTLFAAELGELAAAAGKNRPSTPALIRSSISAAVPDLSSWPSAVKWWRQGNDTREQRGLRHVISLLNHFVLYYRTAFINLTIIL